MNDNEQSIGTLRKISDIETDRNYSELHKIKSFNYDLLTAIQALQEKSEREEGCEYTCTDDDNNEWECSNCNDSIVLYDDNPFVNGFVFCSNCGLPIKSLDYTKYDFETDKYINYILTVDDYISGKPAAEI